MKEEKMPTYTYECEACKKKHELSQGMNDAPLVECPSCKQSKMKRVLSNNVNIQFKGSGFYKTDYSDKKEGGENPPKKGGCGRPGGCGCHG
jgi:putative FmdB family regulatory protein